MSHLKLRGRPRGTGKNDDPQLVEVAAHLLRNPGMKPTKAMRLVMSSRSGWDATDATLMRRWQGKWKAGKNDYLQRARARAESANGDIKDVVLLMVAASKAFVELKDRLNAFIQRPDVIEGLKRLHESQLFKSLRENYDPDRMRRLTKIDPAAFTLRRDYTDVHFGFRPLSIPHTPSSEVFKQWGKRKDE